MYKLIKLIHLYTYIIITKGEKRKIKHKIKQTFSAQSLGRQRSRPHCPKYSGLMYATPW